MSTSKQLTLAAAIVGTIATGLLAVTDVLSPAWALVASSVGAGLYGIVRALQKAAAGEPLKGIFFTTEAWGAGLVLFAAIVTAFGGVVPAKYATVAAIIAAVLTKVAHILQAVVLDQAAPEEAASPTPVTVPNPTGGQQAAKKGPQ